MKTYKEILSLSNGGIFNVGDSALHSAIIRRTKKGAIITNKSGDWYVKESNFIGAFGNLNSIGLQSIEYAVRSPHPARRSGKMKNNMTNSKLLAEFKAVFAETNTALDFRIDVFAPNHYGLSPVIPYERVKDIVVSLYAWAHTHINDNKKLYPDFEGWEFNTEMEVDKLRSSRISMLVDNVINELVNWAKTKEETDER